VNETLPTAGEAGGDVPVTPVSADTVELGEVTPSVVGVVGAALVGVGGLTMVAGEVAAGSVVTVVAGADVTPGKLDGKNPLPAPGDAVVVVVSPVVVVVAARVVLVAPIVVAVPPPAMVVPAAPAVVVVLHSKLTELVEACPDALVAMSAVPAAPTMSTKTATADLLRIMSSSLSAASLRPALQAVTPIYPKGPHLQHQNPLDAMSRYQPGNV